MILTFFSAKMASSSIKKSVTIGERVKIVEKLDAGIGLNELPRQYVPE